MDFKSLEIAKFLNSGNIYHLDEVADVEMIIKNCILYRYTKGLKYFEDHMRKDKNKYLAMARMVDDEPIIKFIESL